MALTMTTPSEQKLSDEARVRFLVHEAEWKGRREARAATIEEVVTHLRSHAMKLRHDGRDTVSSVLLEEEADAIEAGLKDGTDHDNT